MFRQVKRRTAGRRNFDDQDDKRASYETPSPLYASRLSFYDLPPTQEITLEEFESWAIDRLKILIEIESCVARSKSLKEIEGSIKPLLLKFMPLSNNGSVDEKIKDHYSHYILRLVFCRSDELRKNFIKNETILFKVRYNMMSPSEQKEFIESNKHRLQWTYITKEEKNQFFEQLLNASGGSVRKQFLSENVTLTSEELRKHFLYTENFIKLPFEKITNLVSSRSVFLHKGNGYLPTSLQLNLLALEFQEILTTNLIKTFQTIPRLEEDDRLLPLLNNLSRNFANFQYESEIDPGLASDINAQSIVTPSITKHYPLCATHLQRNLIASSHLKYGGRQQLGLFLKGIGLNVDEALKFWSYQFTKNNMSMETFNKEYKYNIRHQYGLEGARINYKPWDCSTILSKPRPNKGESHGCPYRDFTMDALISNLNSMGIKDVQEINAVVDDVQKHEYTVACTRVFEWTHKKELMNKEGLHITHPNLYFDRSRQLERSDANGNNNNNEK
ncbi:PRI2 DNA primase large subunit [Candida maltosa Xu316]|uniref:DNA primase large subunit n=1 Tax=Candida maltosa (strain Xu316) TaxID=1245528 RepID=M3JVT2_CANMX|nr:hypothetical protein G210_2698 [Candida maltosa Xu316]